MTFTVRPQSGHPSHAGGYVGIVITQDTSLGTYCLPSSSAIGCVALGLGQIVSEGMGWVSDCGLKSYILMLDVVIQLSYVSESLVCS